MFAGPKRLKAREEIGAQQKVWQVPYGMNRGTELAARIVGEGSTVEKYGVSP